MGKAILQRILNSQSKTVAEILILLFVVMSVTIFLALSMPSKSLNAPLVLSGTALIIALVATGSILVPAVKGAPWVPTSRRLVNKVLAMTELKPGELLYDLGSGDGRMVISAARDFDARSVGVEIDPFRIFYSRLRISHLHLQDRAKIVRGNFFNISLSAADVVVLYLEQQTNNKLQAKLEKELTKPNCRVVSVVWKFEGWELIRSDEKEMIYVYKPRPVAKRT